MRRGDIWTVAGGPDYASKPRPAVIVQQGSFDELESVTLCIFTTAHTEAWLFRVPVEPDENNGLRAASRLMADKLYTLPRSKLGTRIGRLADSDMLRLNQAILVFLGLSAPQP